MIKSKLLDSIGENNISCAVIGNAPYKTDLSRQIDSSYVMRCNNFKIWTKEIGIRTDLNISSLYNAVNQKLPYPVFGVLPISKTIYQLYIEAKEQHMIWKNHAKLLRLMGSEVWTYDETDPFSEVFTSVASQINAFPTTGLMGIAAARWVGFQQIILSGFTFHQTKQTHYISSESRPAGAHHNPIAEMRLVNKWIAEDNIVYILDELTNKILNDNREN